MKHICTKEATNRIPGLCFYAGLGIALLGITCTIVFQTFHLDIFRLVPECYFRVVTGYYCFGCGGTRSVNALLQGKFLESLYYHIVPAYFFILYTLYMLSYVLFVITKGTVRYMRFHPIYFYIAIVLIIGQCLIKNYLRYQYGFQL